MSKQGWEVVNGVLLIVIGILLLAIGMVPLIAAAVR